MAAILSPFEWDSGELIPMKLPITGGCTCAFKMSASIMRESAFTLRRSIHVILWEYLEKECSRFKCEYLNLQQECHASGKSSGTFKRSTLAC